MQSQFPEQYTLNIEGPRPHLTEYSCKFRRFVSHKEFPTPERKTTQGWRKRLDKLALELMEEPIPGVAELLDFKIEDDKVDGVFEVLPGHGLDSLVEELNGLPGPVWIELAQQLLDTCERAFDHNEIELNFDPRSLYVWPHDGEELWVGFASCEFHVGLEHEKNFWVHWLRSLGMLWYYMATAEWVPYFKLTEKNFAKVGQLQENPALLNFFEHLYHDDIELRVFKVDHLRELLEECKESLASAQIPVPILRRLSRLPSRRRCLSWLVSENQLPGRYELHYEGRDARRPSVIPATDEVSDRLVYLHVLPPKEITGSTMHKANRQAEKLHTEPNADIPVMPILDSLEIDDCHVYVEAKPEGISLAKVLDRLGGGMPLGLVVKILRKVDPAVRKSERNGIEIPSLHPADVYAVSTNKEPLSEEDFGWLNETASFEVKLRALPSRYLHGNDPAAYATDEKQTLMHRIIGFPQEVKSAELAARLLCHRELTRTPVKAAIRRASRRHLRTASWVRATMLGELEKALNPGADERAGLGHAQQFMNDLMAWREMALRPFTRFALTIGAAGAATAALALTGWSVLPHQDTETNSFAEYGNPYLAQKPTNRGFMSAPKRALTPVHSLSAERPMLDPVPYVPTSEHSPKR